WPPGSCCSSNGITASSENVAQRRLAKASSRDVERPGAIPASYVFTRVVTRSRLHWVYLITYGPVRIRARARGHRAVGVRARGADGDRPALCLSPSRSRLRALRAG